jgi:bacteriocin-like protein
MLMKYKDFKTMSQNEMKEIKGGNAPMVYVCTCNTPNMETVVCGYSTYTGYTNCVQGASQFLTSTCGNAGGSCSSGSQNPQ